LLINRHATPTKACGVQPPTTAIKLHDERRSENDDSAIGLRPTAFSTRSPSTRNPSTRDYAAKAN